MTIIVAALSVGPAIMILAGSYMLALDRVPPPKRFWGKPDGRTGAPLVRPRLLGVWFASWGAILMLFLITAVITGSGTVVGSWFLGYALMSLGQTNARYAKFGVSRRAYQTRPSEDSSRANSSDEST